MPFRRKRHFLTRSIPLGSPSISCFTRRGCFKIHKDCSVDNATWIKEFLMISFFSLLDFLFPKAMFRLISAILLLFVAKLYDKLPKRRPSRNMDFADRFFRKKIKNKTTRYSKRCLKFVMISLFLIGRGVVVITRRCLIK